MEYLTKRPLSKQHNKVGVVLPVNQIVFRPEQRNNSQTVQRQMRAQPKQISELAVALKHLHFLLTSILDESKQSNPSLDEPKLNLVITQILQHL